MQRYVSYLIFITGDNCCKESFTACDKICATMFCDVSYA